MIASMTQKVKINEESREYEQKGGTREAHENKISIIWMCFAGKKASESARKVYTQIHASNMFTALVYVCFRALYNVWMSSVKNTLADADCKTYRY